MTSAESEAYNIIKEHINTKRYFYNYYRQLGVEDNIDKDNFKQYSRYKNIALTEINFDLLLVSFNINSAI